MRNKKGKVQKNRTKHCCLSGYNWSQEFDVLKIFSINNFVKSEADKNKLLANGAWTRIHNPPRKPN